MSTAAFAQELIERFSPEIVVPPPAVLDQVRRNTALRSALLSEFGAVSAEEIADLVGSIAARRRTVVDNWMRADRIVAVSWRGQTLVPGFQVLPDGYPDPALHDALHTLRTAGASAWERAIWWITQLSSAGDRRPVDLLLERRAPRASSETGADLAALAARPRDWF